ncbi:MAG: hypothetical protein LKI24_03280 [Acidipropionibacterium sp.]|nr:hypothetical protein [Acidipropionibacterium sp.]
MRVVVHPRVHERHSSITDEDAAAAFESTIRSRLRARTDPPQWVGVGLDEQGRLLQFIAVEEPPRSWLIFHCMPATKGVLAELGLGR